MDKKKYTPEEARQLVNGMDITTIVPDKFIRSRGKDHFVCPICGSGTGVHKTGALEIIPSRNGDGQRLRCFAGGCFGGDMGEDVLGALKIVWGIEHESDVFKRLNIDVAYNQKQNQPAQKAEHKAEPARKPEPVQPKEEPLTDYTEYYKEMHSHIKETDYPTVIRGIDPVVLDRFNIGYDEKWINPKYPNGTPSKRIILPSSKYGYDARLAKPASETSDYEKPYRTLKGGRAGIFNLQCLETAKKPIYIVEGPFDWLSMETVGAESVALGGISEVQKLLDYIAHKKPVQPLIIALDNEPDEHSKAKENVEKAVADLESGLMKLGIRYYKYNPYGEYKDANEALVQDRKAFEAAVRTGERLPNAEALEKYIKDSSVSGCINDYFAEYVASVDTPEIPTGYEQLDNILDGGLYEGLYCIGAISSLGKTTFCLQMADQIAQTGQDVIIIALEMAKSELIAKSISRQTYIKAVNDGIGEIHARTFRQIANGKKHHLYNTVERKLFHDAIEEYSKYCDHVFIQEGIGNISVDDVRKTVQKHFYLTGNKPVVIIDYLQILQPHNERSTDKQNTDYAVVALKRLSRDIKIPIIMISSFNRDNYKEKVNLAAFKESGAVEYSSDVLIGLQLKGAGEKDFDMEASMADGVRKVELVILKNRGGARPKKPILYEYHAAYNYFKEVD